MADIKDGIPKYYKMSTFENKIPICLLKNILFIYKKGNRSQALSICDRAYYMNITDLKYS